MAAALTVLHAAGQTHLDLHPRNVLVTADLQLLLTDYGIPALKLALARPPPPGWLEYQAPELLVADTVPPVDELPACDVYSWGMVSWIILVRAGAPEDPHAALLKSIGPQELARRIRLEGLRPEFPAGMPLAVVRLLMSAWHSEPSSRPPASTCARILEQPLEALLRYGRYEPEGSSAPAAADAPLPPPASSMTAALAARASVAAALGSPQSQPNPEQTRAEAVAARLAQMLSSPQPATRIKALQALPGLCTEAQIAQLLERHHLLEACVKQLEGDPSWAIAQQDSVQEAACAAISALASRKELAGAVALTPGLPFGLLRLAAVEDRNRVQLRLQATRALATLAQEVRMHLRLCRCA